MRSILIALTIVSASLSGPVWAACPGHTGPCLIPAYPWQGPHNIPRPSEIPIATGVWTGAQHCCDTSLYQCGYWHGMYRFHTGRSSECLNLYGAGRP